ncbi:MAG: energy transducer TonB [Candidatus Omnitrophota bacterium]
MNKDIWAGIAGAVIVHAAVLFLVAPVSEPHYEVIVAPSVLEVALVKTPPKKKEEVKAPPVEEPPVKEPEPLPEPPVEEPPPPEKIEEPEIVREEPLPEPPPEPEPQPEPEPVEEPVEEEPEPPEEETETPEVNMTQGVTVDVQPLTHFNQPPAYPRTARRKGWEGRVVLDVLVSQDGDVLSIDILQSSGYGMLDKEAVKAIREWRFEPARLFGNRIEKRVEIPVVFRLTEED